MRGCATRLLLLVLGLAAWLPSTAGNALAQPALSATWTHRDDAPGPPSGPMGSGWLRITYDPVARKTVVIAGSGSTYGNDVWHYDVSQNRWINLEPFEDCPVMFQRFDVPAKRDEHVVDYDSLNRLYWMFGGSGFGCQGSNRTTAAGTTTLSLVDPTLPATANDAYRHFTVNVAGVFAYVSGYSAATKTLSLATPIAGLAPGRSYRLYTQRGGDTWNYSPGSGIWRSFGGPFWGYEGRKPINRLSPAFAAAPPHNAMVMFGGSGRTDTWALDTDLKEWQQMSPSSGPPPLAQIENSMVYDSRNDRFIMFGGECRGNVSQCGGYGKPTDATWVYDLNLDQWTRLVTNGTPPARLQQQMAYDPVNRVTVLFGGRNATTKFNDTWIFDYPTRTWTQLFPAVKPSPRNLGSMTYDTTTNQMILYAARDIWTLSLGAGGTANPVPSIAALSPASAAAGGAGFTLTVTGEGFLTSSVVRWNGSNRPTTPVSATQLRATIPASDIAAAGVAQVTVFNPGPGGGISNATGFTVTGSGGSPGEIVLDNAPSGASGGGRTFTGTWCQSSASGSLGTPSVFSCSEHGTYRFTPPNLAASTYDVYVRWTARSTRSTSVPITVNASVTATRTFNQQVSGSQWVLHGRYSMANGNSVEISNENGQACADGVRLVPAP